MFLCTIGPSSFSIASLLQPANETGAPRTYQVPLLTRLVPPTLCHRSSWQDSHLHGLDYCSYFILHDSRECLSSREPASPDLPSLTQGQSLQRCMPRHDRLGSSLRRQPSGGCFPRTLRSYFLASVRNSWTCFLLSSIPS